MGKSNNHKQKININYENHNELNKKPIKKEFQNEKEKDNEIIIELEIFNDEIGKVIYILCDKNRLNEDNKKYKDFYEENDFHQKNSIILMNIIQNYI